MARIRTIKPGFFRSRDIAPLPFTARLTFIGLWTYVDDAGRGDDDARLVKGDLWQLDDKHTVKRVEGDLEVLARAGLIERYEAHGRRFLRVVSWKDHQRISHPAPSLIPPSPREGSGTAPEASGNPPERLRNDSGGFRVGKEGKGRERKGKEVAPPSAGSDDWSESDLHPGFDGSPAPSGGEPVNTSLPEEQVRLNVESARAVRAQLHVVKEET